MLSWWKNEKVPPFLLFLINCFKMKRIISVIVALIIINMASAQVIFEEGEKPSVFDRMYFGGNFSASFGDITLVYVSPIVGYMITRGLSAGVGITYQYYKNKFYNYESNTYGGKIFARQNINILKLPLFAYAEYESLNLEIQRFDLNGEAYLAREWYPRMYLGGGFFQPIGRRSGFFILVMYDVIYGGSGSPYSSPWVYRIGFSF